MTPESAAFQLRAILLRLPRGSLPREHCELRLACIRRRDPAKALEDVAIIARQLVEEVPGLPELRRDVDALRTEIAQAVAELRRA